MRICVTISEELKKEAEVKASKLDISLASLIRIALAKYLKEGENGN